MQTSLCSCSIIAKAAVRSGVRQCLSCGQSRLPTQRLPRRYRRPLDELRTHRQCPYWRPPFLERSTPETCALPTYHSVTAGPAVSTGSIIYLQKKTRFGPARNPMPQQSEGQLQIRIALPSCSSPPILSSQLSDTRLDRPCLVPP